MARKRTFGQLSKASRERAERAGRQYGLNRQAVRKRYNRGTYNPLSTDPLMRLPREVRAHADESGEVDWQQLALDNVRRQLSDYFKYNDDAVVFLTQNMNDAAARLVSLATEDELLAYASIQPDKTTGELPPIEQWNLPPGITLEDVTVNVNGQPVNIFWYHLYRQLPIPSLP